MKDSTLKRTAKATLLFSLVYIASSSSSLAQTNTWVQESDFGYDAANVPEPSPRYWAVGFSIASKAYLGTGYDGNYSKNFWEYDPALNTWTQKADFGGTARYLAVGFSIGSKGYLGSGYDGNYCKDFWEYDPAVNNWTQKADFGGTARSSAVGFSIGSKGYLGTGNKYDGGYIYYKDFWEYEPALNTWTQKADFGGTARSEAVAFSIGSKGYLGTGYDANYCKDFWEYDPDANTWTQKTDFGGTARSEAVGFSIGSKGYLGTGYLNNFKKDFWEYDPDANTWMQKADFGGTARSAAVGFGIGNKGYVGTGYTFGGRNKDFWEYEPALNIWTQKADFGGTARSGAVGFSIGSKGYLGTGYDGGDYNKDFWEYDPDLNTWTQKADFGGSARSGAVGFNIGSKGYLGTGSATDGDKKDFWEYDPDANIWTQKADFGGIARNLATGFSISSKAYLGTGYSYETNTYKKDFWEYDPDANTWTKKADFGGTVRYGAVGFSIDGNGYMGTGYSFNTSYTYYKDFWEYDPDANTWTQKADFGGTARGYAVSFSTGSKGYLGTGYDGIYPDYYKKDFWEYDPELNTWMQKADFGGSARYHATGFSIGSKGYIGTGENSFSATYKDFWEYTPNGMDTCNIPTSLSTANITPTSANLKWDAVSGAIGYKVMYKVAGVSQWTFTSSADHHKIITGLTANTNYVWKAKSVCNSSPVISSDASVRARFITAPLRWEAAHKTIFEVYPNPVSQSATILFSLSEESLVVMEIIDVNGKLLRVIANENFLEGTHEVKFNRESLIAGIYFLQVKTNQEAMLKKIVID